MPRLMAVGLLLGLLAGCGGRDPVYESCSSVDDCEAPEGEAPACVDKEGAGFCTWECEADAQCSEADSADFVFVCASFEEAGGKYCFPSCEGTDGEEACPRDMTCRSTGGGVNNRRVCFPAG